MLRILIKLVFIALSLSDTSAAFYLPGVAPRGFSPGDKVVLSANKLTSTKTQVPYEYYDLPYCRPAKRKSQSENLGEVLAGDSETTSPYLLEMKVPQSCTTVCRKEYSRKELKQFRDAIEDDYRVHWTIDSLPAAIRVENEAAPDSPYYIRGFPVGFTVKNAESGKNMHFLHNHVRITVRYHEDASLFQGSRIVGFEVAPFSFNHAYDRTQPFVASGTGAKPTVLSTCNAMSTELDFGIEAESVDAFDEDVIFTYDVFWASSETAWANRWDVYLRGNPDDQIHWFSIVNSFMIVVFLTGMVGLILSRALHRDIAQYNSKSLGDDVEETGWKLVHGDVFRPPQQQPVLFAALVGTGVQIFAMVFALMTFALLGFLSPANRGGLLTALLLLFVFMGRCVAFRRLLPLRFCFPGFTCFAGYYSSRLYKSFEGREWKRCTVATALAFPGAVFSIFFGVNLVLWHEGSSGAVPFGTLFALLLLWFGVSVPLVFLGSYFGLKKERIEHPVRTNQIARQVPEQPWYMAPWVAFLVGGVLPFGAVCIELFFIMAAIWLHQIYYVFGFLFLVLLILIATCAEITVVLCYFQLCGEDFNWWWRAFLSSGSAAFYLFLYSIWYLVAKLEMDSFASFIIYFGYMSIICLTFFLFTGCVGFFSCFWFVRKIYGSIKID